MSKLSHDVQKCLPQWCVHLMFIMCHFLDADYISAEEEQKVEQMLAFLTEESKQAAASTAVSTVPCHLIVIGSLFSVPDWLEGSSQDYLCGQLLIWESIYAMNPWTRVQFHPKIISCSFLIFLPQLFPAKYLLFYLRAINYTKIYLKNKPAQLSITHFNIIFTSRN